MYACISKIPLISNQYLLFIFNTVEIGKRNSIDTETSFEKGYVFRITAISNKLFAKT